MQMQKLWDQLKTLSRFSKSFILLGLLFCLVLYLAAGIARANAPDSESYLSTMAIYYGCMEMAPASLAICTIVAFVGDLAIRDKQKK